jgi:hypothetical protein
MDTYIYGLKINKKISGNIDIPLKQSFENTDVVFELYNNFYYLYLKNTKNIKKLQNHEKIYLQNTLKRVRSDFIYNLFPQNLELLKFE